jgi:hypothetical protein
LVIIFLLSAIPVRAQNPIIRHIFSADPSAHVFKDRIYVYPSHDIPAPEGKNLRKDWFCMEDYHVFSSDNLSEWIDHGIILTQYKVPWVDTTSFSMWAPDCVEHNGKYFFYFPAISKEIDSLSGNKKFRIGVAVSNNPEGPFTPLAKPIQGVEGIDPCVFIDEDGQAYLYWSLQNIYVAKLKDNMTELASSPVIISNLPQNGLKEGPWVFKHNNIYYLTFPHVANKIERLEYATGSNPMGPFKMTGIIMDESPMNCWTNHHSILQYKGQWYLFYHQNALSPWFDKNRSICVDSLFFNSDGTIQKVKPTLRGVGNTIATMPIQIDRYTSISNNGITIDFLNPLNTFEGWKTIFSKKNSWLQYNSVLFTHFSQFDIRTRSETGGTLAIFLDHRSAFPIFEINIPASSDWLLLKTGVKNLPEGIHHLIIEQKTEGKIEVDWVKFE